MRQSLAGTAALCPNRRISEIRSVQEVREIAPENRKGNEPVVVAFLLLAPASAQALLTRALTPKSQRGSASLPHNRAMLAKVCSADVKDIEVYPVEVEVTVSGQGKVGGKGLVTSLTSTSSNAEDGTPMASNPKQEL
jgi:hypothetical protein